jgi:hypothetical protein
VREAWNGQGAKEEKTKKGGVLALGDCVALLLGMLLLLSRATSGVAYSARKRDFCIDRACVCVSARVYFCPCTSVPAGLSFHCAREREALRERRGLALASLFFYRKIKKKKMFSSLRPLFAAVSPECLSPIHGRMLTKCSPLELGHPFTLAPRHHDLFT